MFGHSAGVEWTFLAISAVLALWSLMVTVSTHGQRWIWAPVVAGFAIWASAIAGWTEPAPEFLMAPLGGLVVAAGLFWNGQLRHRAVCASACACPAPH